MGKRGKLSQVAQRYAAIDRNRPETCCLIGKQHGMSVYHLLIRGGSPLQATSTRFGESMQKPFRSSGEH